MGILASGESGLNMLTTLLFIISISSAYVVPYALDCPTYVSWMAVDMVYVVDMDISRQLYSDEMNGSGISHSEAMTYAGLATATTAGILSLLPEDKKIPPPMDFVIYFIVGSATYGVWHGLDEAGYLN